MPRMVISTQSCDYSNECIVHSEATLSLACPRQRTPPPIATPSPRSCAVCHSCLFAVQENAPRSWLSGRRQQEAIPQTQGACHLKGGFPSLASVELWRRPTTRVERDRGGGAGGGVGDIMARSSGPVPGRAYGAAPWTRLARKNSMITVILAPV